MKEIITEDLYSIINSYNPMECPEIEIVDGIGGEVWDSDELEFCVKFVPPSNRKRRVRKVVEWLI